MRSVLVTGGAGFIGSHLVAELTRRGVQVRVLDTAVAGPFGPSGAAYLGVTPLSGDIRDPAICHQACRGVDVVFHLAALVSVPQSVADPQEAEAVNTDGTLNLLVAARDSGVRRFVVSSSAAVYGETELIPTPEEAATRPTSPYGAQKLMAEHYARLFTELYGLETVSLRYFNVYGPGQKLTSAYAAAIPRFLTRLLAGDAPVVFGDGEQTRDFCHVRDVVRANVLAATTTEAEAPGGAFNVAGGGRVTLNTLLDEMQAVLGTTLSVHREPARVGDIRHSGADIRRAQAVLGFAPGVSLREGLIETAAFYRGVAGTKPSDSRSSREAEDRAEETRRAA